jgi:DNA modification methylase
MSTGVKLKGDKKLRDALFTPEAMSHPAKAHLGMMWEIVERYTEPGQWVLDPFGGVGSTLIATLMGRNVVCVEMEQHFLDPMKASWAKMRQHGPMLGHTMGEAVMLKGDARCLPLGSVDGIVTSPPYEGTEQHDKRSLSPVEIQKRAELFGKASGENFNTPGRLRAIQRSYSGYTRPDTIITSPPYGHESVVNKGRPGESVVASEKFGYLEYYSDAKLNIGNMKNSAYWEAMAEVYSECYRVLRPGGTLVLILKGFTRDGEYVDLPQQTSDMVEPIGFREFDRWERELWTLSFWRILQKRRDPQAFDDRLKYETILGFRR